MQEVGNLLLEIRTCLRAIIKGYVQRSELVLLVDCVKEHAQGWSVDTVGGDV